VDADAVIPRLQDIPRAIRHRRRRAALTRIEYARTPPRGVLAAWRVPEPPAEVRPGSPG